jgi:hypothetical protein
MEVATGEIILEELFSADCTESSPLPTSGVSKPARFATY